MALRVVAVAAPEWPDGCPSSKVLNSCDPVSLFNACRIGGSRADDTTSVWGNSNWHGGRSERRSRFLLLHSASPAEMERYARLLLKERPNLLLIGAMTLCLPGAVACAELARELLGDRVLIVLGGRHVNETFYVNAEGRVEHDLASPLALTSRGELPNVFDLVASGEGEFLIEAVGERIGRNAHTSERPRGVVSDLAALSFVPGRWLLGTVQGDQILHLKGIGPDLDRDSLPPPASVFGVGTRFGVFEGRLTAHVFSDSGNGCVFDCDFCSERQSVAGLPSGLLTAGERLSRQLTAAYKTITEDHRVSCASAFIEDSTLLAGSERATRYLIESLGRQNLDLTFGGQYTIDQILAKKPLLGDLRRVGLRYVFVGIETFDPKDAGGIHKDRRASPWIARAEAAISLLDDLGIGCGVAILFGLGESHANRLRLLEQLRSWRVRYNAPNPISLNWAVQHPLKGLHPPPSYKYLEWGTPIGPYLYEFRHFGEASLRYGLPGIPPPTLQELEEINQEFEAFVQQE